MAKPKPFEFKELGTPQPANLAARFINFVMMEPCTVFLTNGVKLNGTITINDTDCFVLSRDGAHQLVFKHAVATVMPQDAFALVELVEA